MRCDEVGKQLFEDGGEEGVGACITITLELKGAHRLLGSLLPGHFGGREACIQQGCLDPSELTSQVSVASGLCGAALREVTTEATPFLPLSPAIQRQLRFGPVSIFVGLLPIANEASFFLIYFRKRETLLPCLALKSKEVFPREPLADFLPVSLARTSAHTLGSGPC